MEFWEGAVLVIGGVWLVGRMSRKSLSHPVNVVPQVNGSGSGNLTTLTNTDGSGTLVAGDTSITPPLPPLPVRTAVLVKSPITAPPRPAPVSNARLTVARGSFRPASPIVNSRMINL